MAYCAIADIRDEGFLIADYSDALVTRKIALACKAIDRATGRWFESRAMDFKVDGRGVKSLRLGFPIISISALYINDEALDLTSDEVIVYNRHLTQNLLEPDDRDDPRIELEQDTVYAELTRRRAYTDRDSYTWPRGQQNIRVVGNFGYTDYSSTVAMGVVPPEIEQLAVLLTCRDLALVSDPEARHGARSDHLVTEIKTEDQSIKYGRGAQSSVSLLSQRGLTGDPEIDTLILAYRRPARIGSW